MASSFERKLDAARSAYEENDPLRALRRLEDARRVALGGGDDEQLRRLLDFADAVIAREERTEIEREHVVYAIKQNLRQLERRRAFEDERAPVDPYPNLETSQPQTRTYLSTSVKVWIGIGIAAATVVIVLWLLSPLLD